MQEYAEIIKEYDRQVEDAITAFCAKYNIVDLAQESQNRFNACLMYIQETVFYNKKALKDNKLVNNGSCTMTTNNAFDYNLLWEILTKIYIKYANLYSKEISLNGFSKLLDIDYSNILSWSNRNNNNINNNNIYSDNEVLNKTGGDIYKKLMQENENSNSDLLNTGKNPVGIMARLNHIHNWSAQQIQSETQARALGAAALPKLAQPKEQLELVKIIDNT